MQKLKIDAGSILGPGRFPGERSGCPPQNFYQDNPMDRGAWQATVHGIEKKSYMTEHAHTCFPNVVYTSLSQGFAVAV